MLCTAGKNTSYMIFKAPVKNMKIQCFFYCKNSPSLLFFSPTDYDISASTCRNSSRSRRQYHGWDHVAATCPWFAFRKIQKMSLNVFPHAARRPPPHRMPEEFPVWNDYKKADILHAEKHKVQEAAFKHSIVGVWVAQAYIVSSISHTHKSVVEYFLCVCVCVCVCVWWLLPCAPKCPSSLRA